MNPKVTVLMAVFNGARYLRESVDSILSQTFRDFELLVIDDASTDASAEILRSYADERIRIVRNDGNRGLTASLNIGLRNARAELIARQDADDRSRPARLQKQIAFLDSHPACAVLGTDLTYINESGHRIRTVAWPRCSTPIAIRWQLMFESPFAHSSVMFRKSVVWNELGGYDESFRASQDYELWSRVSKRHAMSNLLEPLIDLRAHRESISAHRTAENMRQVSEVLRANLNDTIGNGSYERWLDFWVSVHNPANHPAIANLDTFRADLDRIRAAFHSKYPEAKGDREIERQVGGALARVACRIAQENRAVALPTFAGAFAHDARLALRTFPRFVVNLLRPRTSAKREPEVRRA